MLDYSALIAEYLSEATRRERLREAAPRRQLARWRRLRSIERRRCEESSAERDAKLAEQILAARRA